MPIEFRCTGCGKLLRTPDESVGKKARCQSCGTIVDVPAASSEPAAAPPPPPAPGSSWGSSPAADGGLASGAGAGGSSPWGGGSGGGAASAANGNPFADGGGFGGGGAGGSGGGGGTGSLGENPYAAPRLTPPPAAGSGFTSGGPLEHHTVTVEQVLTTTWEIYKPQFGMAIVLGMVMMGLGSAPGIVTFPINLGAQATREPAVIVAGQIVGQLISFVAQTWIQLGAAAIALHWARTGIIDIARMFQVGPIFARGLGLFFLTQLLILGILLVCLLPLGVLALTTRNEEAMVIAGIVGALVAIPIVSVVTLKLFLGTMFLVDRNVPVMEAFSLSNRFMAGNKLNVFMSGIVLGVLGMFVVICTCFLGILAFAPFATLYSAVVYLLITGQPMLLPGRMSPR